MKFGKEKYEEFVSPEIEIKSQEEQDSVSFTSLVDGSFFSSPLVKRQIPFIMMFFALCIISISIRNSTEKAYRSKSSLESKVRELKYESTSITAGLMFISKQSEVLKRIEKSNLGLIESSEPPMKIIVKKEVLCR